MENWFAFRAYNTQTLYGFGTEKEAGMYADHLNSSREINVYAPYSLASDEVAALGLEDNSEAFNIGDSLMEIED
jgi:hypothetical protein